MAKVQSVMKMHSEENVCFIVTTNGVQEAKQLKILCVTEEVVNLFCRFSLRCSAYVPEIFIHLCRACTICAILQMLFRGWVLQCAWSLSLAKRQFSTRCRERDTPRAPSKIPADAGIISAQMVLIPFSEEFCCQFRPRGSFISVKACCCVNCQLRHESIF